MHLFGYDEAKESKKRYTVILPLDTLILLLIVVVLLFTLSFSLGVERGRKIVYLTADDKNKTQSAPASSFEQLNMAASGQSSVKTDNLSDSKVIREVVSSLETNAQPVTGQRPQAEKGGVYKITIPDKKSSNSSGDNIQKRYAIQVASYNGNEQAQRTAKLLEKKGYPVFVSKKGKYIAVFVGEFTDKGEAQRNERLLKSTYKDCLLRVL